MDAIRVEDYIVYFGNEFQKYLKSDVECSVHNEFYRDDNADVNVTVKLLPAQIQLGVIQQPLEIIVEGKDNFKEELIDGLTEFACVYNEVVFELNSAKFKQFYTTPNVIGVFQQTGKGTQFAMSVSATIITFGLGALTAIEISNEITSEQIECINYNAAFLGETNATGAVGDSIAKNIIETCGLSQTMTFVPKNTKLTKAFMDHIFMRKSLNSFYKLKIKIMDSVVYEIDCVLLSGSYSQVSNGVPILQLCFVVADDRE